MTWSPDPPPPPILTIMTGPEYSTVELGWPVLKGNFVLRYTITRARIDAHSAATEHARRRATLECALVDAIAKDDALGESMLQASLAAER